MPNGKMDVVIQKHVSDLEILMKNLFKELNGYGINSPLDVGLFNRIIGDAWARTVGEVAERDRISIENEFGEEAFKRAYEAEKNRLRNPCDDAEFGMKEQNEEGIK